MEDKYIKQCYAKGGKWKDNKCLFTTASSKPIKPHTIRNLIITLLLVLGLGLSTVVITGIGTFLHEFAGHTLIARLLGCEANWDIETFTGQTSFNNCLLQKKSNKICSYDSECSDNRPSTNDRCVSGYCQYENKAINILIGIASIVVIYFIAITLWFWLDKDSIWRMFSIFIMLYSCIPSAFPSMQGSDMSYIVSQGFPVWLAWILYFIIAGTFMWLLVVEVTDKPYFQKFLS